MATADALTDESIVRSVLGGDVEAYAALVERYRARLLGLAFHLCGDWDTATDLVQDTLIAAYKCLDRLRNPGAFAGWVAGILRNKVRNHRRDNHVATVSLDQLVEAGFDPPNPNPAPVMSEEERSEVLKCVESLPDQYREVLMLRYVEDLSYKDIAAFLDVPVTTVTMRLAHGRKALLKKAREAGLL